MLNSKFFSGVNLITGRSNLRTLVEILAEFVVAVFLIIFLLDDDARLKNIPIKEVALVYFFKYCYIFIDSFTLVFKRVLNVFDLINNIIDAVFWFLTYHVLGNQNMNQDNLLSAWALGRFIWSILFWGVSAFVFARDDPVSSSFF